MKEQYAAILPELRTVARAHGYALALHGSGMRDLDLIAVPWIEDAAADTVLVEALRACVGGFITNDPDAQVGDYTRRSPESRPHGRLAWAIYLFISNGSLYIDLSVMPKVAP